MQHFCLFLYVFVGLLRPLGSGTQFELSPIFVVWEGLCQSQGCQPLGRSLSLHSAFARGGPLHAAQLQRREAKGKP